MDNKTEIVNRFLVLPTSGVASDIFKNQKKLGLEVYFSDDRYVFIWGYSLHVFIAGAPAMKLAFMI